jgi:hypothetical protein
VTPRELIDKIAPNRAEKKKRRRRLKSSRRPADRGNALRRLVTPAPVPKGVSWEPGSMRVEFSNVTIGIRNLPEAFDGFRIGHITDTHLGTYVSTRYLTRQIDAVNRVGVDAAVFTGDLISRNPRRVRDAARILGKVEAPWGHYAVPGNHDYVAGIEAFRREMAHAGYRVLVNEHLRIEKDGQRIVMAGVDDSWQGAPDHRKALEGVDSVAETVVMLVHVPDYLPLLSGTGVDLVLCGHTHGGQVWLPFFGPPIVPSAFGKDYARGLIEHHDMQMYVSRGVGHMLWLRLNCRPELPIITLRRV